MLHYLKNKTNKKNAYRIIDLASICVIYFINVSLILYGTAGLNSAMSSAKDISEAIIGTAVSICTFMQGITGITLGFVIDKKGVKFPFALGSILIFAGGMLISFFTYKELHFIIYYGVIIGTGMGLGGIVTTQSTINLLFNKYKSIAMAIVFSSGSLGGFIAPIIMEKLISVGNWTLGWSFISSASIISVFLSVFILKNKPTDMEDVPDWKYCKESEYNISSRVSEVIPKLSIKDIISNITYHQLIITSVSRSILYYTVLAHIIIFAVSNGMPREKAVLIISIMALSSFLGRLLFGILCQFILKPKLCIAIGNLVMSFGVLFITFMPTNYSSIYIGGTLVGIGLGAGYIATPLIYADYFGSINFPMVMGVSSPINFTISAFGPLIAGFVSSATGSYKFTFTLMSIISIVGGITVIFSKPLNSNKILKELS